MTRAQVVLNQDKKKPRNTFKFSIQSAQEVSFTGFGSIDCE
jgi:hypothetical protein